MAEKNPPVPKLSLGQRTKDIIEWIDAFIILVDLDTKYFELSINEEDKRKAKNYRKVSEKYSELTDNLIKMIP